MNPFEMVVAIVGISAVASVLRAKYGHGRANRRGLRMGGAELFESGRDSDLAAENTALRDEMRGLKDRIQVLERLATDDESDARRLDREIEKLRDRTATGKTGNGE
jgi:uncharacterized protein YlxW (UPF0749 family)